MDSQLGGVSDIMAKVALGTNPGGIIYHAPRDSKHESLIHTNHVKSITIRITDERNRLLNLNGLHCQVGIMFRFVSLKAMQPVLDLRDLLKRANGPLPPQQPTEQQKAAQRKRTLKKGKQKIARAKATAKTAAAQQQSKNSSGS